MTKISTLADTQRWTAGLAYGGLLEVVAPATVLTGYAIYSLFFRLRYKPQNVETFRGQWYLGPFANVPGFLEVVSYAVRKMHLEYFVVLHERIGRTFAAKPPLSPWWIFTRDPRNVEHILSKNFQNYDKGSWFTGKLKELLGNGIFNVDGQEWFHQRKVASHMFTARLFKEHIWVVVRRNAKKLRQILEDVSEDTPVDIFNLMNRFTLDTIGEIGFGKSIGSLEDPSSPFLLSFDRAQQISFTRFYIPIWPMFRFFGILSERETTVHFGRLDAYSRSVVRELREGIAREIGSKKSEGVAWTDLEARKSFVGLFLEEATKKGEDLSEDYLRDLVLNFLIAGRDTTAQALSWAIFLLCKHPETAAKATEEVVRVLADDDPTYEQIARMPYLQAVLNEALRLYPSVPLDLKVALEDDVWPDGTVVRGGTVILYNIYGMARDPEIWGADACDFRPERWLSMDGPVDVYKYPVFNAGPRECLGKRLAQVEMKTCLAVLLPRMSFRLAVPEAEVVTDGQLTIGMGNGLPCFVHQLARRDRKESAASTALCSERSVSDGGSTA